MSRKGENIFKRKDGRWEARYIKHYENGKAQYGFLYGHSYTEVKAKKQAAMLISASNPESCSSAVTMEKLARLWLSDIRFSVKESTFTRYHQTVHKYIIPLLGSYELYKLDSLLINSFSEQLLSGEGAAEKCLSAKTVTDILCVVKSLIKFGKMRRYVFGNVDGIRFPKKTSGEPEILPGDIRLILESAIIASDDTTGLGILLALFTGLRIGELCGLRWEDINLEAKTVSVLRTVERISDLDPNVVSKTKIIIGAPKTDSAKRTIPLPSFIVDYLQKFDRFPQNYVISGGPEPVEPNRFYTRYRSYMKKHGIDGYTFHALRHTFATRCVEEGFDTKSLSEILGHSNVSTTLSFYVHPSIEQKRAQMERLTPKGC